MKSILLFFTLFSINSFAQNCDSLIIIYTTHYNEDDSVYLSNIETDSLKNGLIMSRNFMNSRIEFTYDSLNRMKSMLSLPDSNVYFYDSNSRLTSIDYYRHTGGVWSFRSDTGRVNYFYSNHGLDSVFISAWDGSTMNPFYRSRLYYNSGDTLFKKISESYDSLQWSTDTITIVKYDNFGSGVYRTDTAYIDSISPSTAVEVFTYDSLDRIVELTDIHYGFPDRYEQFAYDCNQLAHWWQSWSGGHSGNFMDIILFDSQCRIKRKEYGHSSQANGSNYYVDEYSYVGCSTMAVHASGDATICSGDSTEISAMYFGGTGPFHIHWSPSQGLACDTCLVTNASPDQTGLYTIFVTDSSGHTSTDYVIITVINRPFANLYVSSIDTSTSCQSAVLTADSVNGYGFTWWKDGVNIYPFSGAHLPISYNGQYIVKVDNGSVCPQAYDTLTFNYFTHLPPSVTLQRSCHEIYATPSVPSQIQWFYNNQLIVDSARDTLVMWQNGLYSAIITDSSGCVSSAAQMSYDQLSATSTAHPSCKNSCDGYIRANTWHYNNFIWSDGSTAQVAQFLCSGIYSVTVSDQYGCSLSLTDTVHEYPAANLSYITTGTSSPSACDAVVIPVDSGNTPYDAYYRWEDFTYDVMHDSMCAGWHTILITPHFSGCQQTDSFFIPSSLSTDTCSIIANRTNMSCNGIADGTITIGCSTGSPFACNWFTPNLNANQIYQEHLHAGNYNCMIIDQHGCIDSAQITITEPAPLSVSFNIYHSPCGDSCIVTAIGSGGTPPYYYQWCDFSNNNVLINCIPECRLYLTDSKHCFHADTVVQLPVSPISFQTINIPPACSTCNDGIIIVNASGGVPPYSYSADNGASQFSDTLTNLSDGYHNVCVTGSDGCIVCSDTPILLNIDPVISGEHFKVYPNPFYDVATFSFYDFNPLNQTKLLVFDVFGRIMKEYPVVAKQLEISRENLSAGIYTLELIVANNIIARGKIVID